MKFASGIVIALVAAATQIGFGNAESIRGLQDGCPPSTYECPKDSSKSVNVACLTSFDDCECATGFVKRGRGCKNAKTFCPAVFYECPANSMKKDSSPCKTSFADCECFDGFPRNEATQTCREPVSV